MFLYNKKAASEMPAAFEWGDHQVYGLSPHTSWIIWLRAAIEKGFGKTADAPASNAVVASLSIMPPLITMIGVNEEIFLIPTTKFTVYHHTRLGSFG
jgi:hypothetical protein